jgi:elongation factor G
VVDLVKMKAALVADGKPREAEIPGEAMDAAKEWREKLIEAVAETDDDLLAKYLEEGSIAEGEMLGALRRAIASGTLVPVLAAAATRLIGVHPLMDLIVEEFPSPADVGTVEGTDVKTKAASTRAADPKAPFAALVFKTISDPHVGKLSVFRVYSGRCGRTARSSMRRAALGSGWGTSAGCRARRRSRWRRWGPARSGWSPSSRTR